MKLLAHNESYSTWLLIYDFGKEVLLKSYIGEPVYKIVKKEDAKDYSFIKELEPFEYGQEVLVSNDEKGWFRKEYVCYLPEKNKYLCRDKHIYFEWKYCKGITISDEEPIQQT